MGGVIGSVPPRSPRRWPGTGSCPGRPAPVTTTTPGSGVVAVADAVVGRHRVDAGPAPHHRGQRPTEHGLGPGPQVVVEVLLDGEVEGLVVDMGVADGQPPGGPLRRAGAACPTRRWSAPGRGARPARGGRRPGSSASSRRRPRRWSGARGPGRSASSGAGSAAAAPRPGRPRPGRRARRAGRRCTGRRPSPRGGRRGGRRPRRPSADVSTSTTWRRGSHV